MSEYRLEYDFDETVKKMTEEVQRKVDQEILDANAHVLEEFGYVKRDECEMEYIETYEYPDGEEDYLCKCSECGRTRWEPAYNLPKFCGGCGRMVKR